MDPDEAASLKARLDTVVSAVEDIRISIAQLAQSYARLAVLEERQNNGKEEMARAWREIDSLRTAVDTLKAAAPINAQTTNWVNKVIGLVIAFAVGAALTMGFGRHQPRADVPVHIEGKR